MATNLQNPGNIQRLSRLYNCLSRKSSKSCKYSKNFSPVNLSQPQIITVLKIIKDFFACKIVLAANHQYPGIIQRLFRLQNCLILKSSKSWKYSKTFSPVKLTQPQIIKILEIFKEFLACKVVQPQIIIILKKFKDFSPAKLSQPQLIKILEMFEDLLASKNV